MGARNYLRKRFQRIDIMADKLTGMVPDTRMITTMNDEGNTFGIPRSYGDYQTVQKCQTVINVYVFAFLKGHLLNGIHIASKHCLVLCPCSN